MRKLLVTALALMALASTLAKADVVVVRSPDNCNVPSNTTTYTWVDYISAATYVSVPSVLITPSGAMVVYHRCFATLTACQASQGANVAGNWTQAMGNPAQAWEEWGHTPGPCYAEQQ